MKRYLFVVAAVIVYCSMSCNTNPGASAGSTRSNDAAQKNLEAAHAVNAAILSGNVSNLDSFIASDAVDHAGMAGEIKGVDSIKAELAKIHIMSADMKSETIKELADSEYVFQWMRYTGTASTADMGMPVGTKYDITAIQVSKFNSDGKATEHWEFMQPADMMKMMQHNTGGTANKKDATKNK
jgi:hypothetical protein